MRAAILFGAWFLAALGYGQNIRVLFLGGGGATATHNADSMNTVISPVLRINGMTVDYKTNESILNADSLAHYDVMFIYNSKKGSNATGGDKSPDLTTAQENALYAWVDSGHAVIGVHCATSSYLLNPRYLQLFGAAFKDHGASVVPTLSIVKPTHPSLTGVSVPPAASDAQYWDEDRTHTFSKTDTVILSIITNDNKNPWTWVRPEGKGWVYYTSSGHDDRSWSDPNFQKQLIQALKWGASLNATALMPWRKGVSAWIRSQGIFETDYFTIAGERKSVSGAPSARNGTMRIRELIAPPQSGP